MQFEPIASSSRGNCYALREGDRALLIECGLALADIRRHVRVAQLDGCLISHHHQDHARAARNLAGLGVDLFASRETFAALDLTGHHRARVLLDRRGAKIPGGWAVLPWAAVHDAAGALGFMVQAPSGDRLLYACDTAYVPHRFRGLTHLAIEANYSAALLEASDAEMSHKVRVVKHHMSLETALEVMAANDLAAVREIWLLHLSDRHSDAAAFLEAAQRATGRLVRIAPRGAPTDGGQRWILEKRTSRS